MKKIFQLVILAVATFATAHAQQDVQVKCNWGHDQCTIVHDANNVDETPVSDRGNNRVQDPDTDDAIVTNPEKGQDAEQTDPDTGNDQITTGNGETDEECAAREAAEQRRRLEEARRRANDSRLSDEARRAAAMEALRAQGRFRYELNTALARVKRAAISTSTKLRKEQEVLKKWQTEMVKAGLTRELMQWFSQNKNAISELVQARAELTWLAKNKEAIADMVSDYDSLKELYPKGGSYFKALGNEARAAKATAKSAQEDATAAGTSATEAKGAAYTALVGAVIAGVIGLIALGVALLKSRSGSKVPKPAPASAPKSQPAPALQPAPIGGAQSTPLISLTPNMGPAAGGTVVTIKATGLPLTETMKVNIGGYNAVVTRRTSNELDVTTPAGTVGKADLWIGEPGQPGSLFNDAFEYTP